ncbi:sulfotransferase family protein [Pontivivens ytuae]|uniref:Sulfotransferase family protein n=1 Tax=Pontivivens ytuae TaxID=2789856 RepID=A0A7S9QES5_9RHOB|nr:sulfotransferase family protein [Pontivivens ytuae]QPH55762.1 sulfotransferase family protein [Pontivivens ytuae]
MALQIIGAGLGRTGTESLRNALIELGFAPCHHMYALRDDPVLVPPWHDVVCGGAAPDWDALFAGFEAQVDWPGAAYWRETTRHFPEAKVILTLREAEAWWASLEQTILPFVALKGRHTPPHRNAIAELTETILQRLIGPDLTDRAAALSAFEAHNAAVRAAIPPERLLELPVGAGWAPLCAFLGVPVPDQPYPSGNTSAQFRERVARNLAPDPG